MKSHLPKHWMKVKSALKLSIHDQGHDGNLFSLSTWFSSGWSQGQFEAQCIIAQTFWINVINVHPWLSSKGQRRNIGGCMEGSVFMMEVGKAEWREGHLESSLVLIASFHLSPLHKEGGSISQSMQDLLQFPPPVEVSDYETDHQYHFEVQEESHKDKGRHFWTCAPSGFVYVLRCCRHYEASLDGRLDVMLHAAPYR